MQSSVSIGGRSFRVSGVPRLREPGWRALLAAGVLAASGGLVTLAGVARPSVADSGGAVAPEPALVAEVPPWRRVPLDPEPIALPAEAIGPVAETAAAERYRVSGDGATLRAAPDPAAAPLAVLAGGTVVERVAPPVDEGAWHAVRAAEQEGWVPAAVLEPLGGEPAS